MTAVVSGMTEIGASCPFRTRLAKVGNPPDSADRRHRCEWLLRANKPSSFATVPSDTPDYHVQKGAELA
jgi:hypothetical protein